MRTVTLGGKNRVGSGSKIKTNLREFDRSTFDMSSTLKTTISAGTLVPIWQDVALPGTTHDINIYLDMITGPTIGPLFGSFKLQADAYSIPIRLYQAQMHNNKNGVGLHMENIKMPLLRLKASNPKSTTYNEPNFDLDNYQINPSHVLSYTNDLRGLGIHEQPIGEGLAIVNRDVNATSYIGYYDIGKNFYCNKQEGVGYIIHSTPLTELAEFTLLRIFGSGTGYTLTEIPEDGDPVNTFVIVFTTDSKLQGNIENVFEPFDPERITIYMTKEAIGVWYRATDIFENISWVQDSITPTTWLLEMTKPKQFVLDQLAGYGIGNYRFNRGATGETSPRLTEFPLSDIDDLREDILSKIKETEPYIIEWGDIDSDIPDTSVFKIPLSYSLDGDGRILSSSMTQDQDGLMVGTYMSDVFNNWLDSEQVGLADTLSAIKVQNVEGQDLIYVNEISLKTKVWELFNAINTMGGSLIDYYDAVYDHEVWMGTYSPVYCGGISKTLRFQQIISNAETPDQPLGTLAGRGVLTGDKHGGSLKIKTDEPSVIMIIAKLTPMLDYSQGNWWFNNIKTMSEFHNPYLDRIGFQDLITDKMAWWDTKLEGTFGSMTTSFRSAGKQTAWIDYQTNYNRVKGNFAKKNNQMFMVQARNYEANIGGTTPTIANLTTYIDPANSNYIFAETELTAMNFMLEAHVEAEARRKMSSKTQPIQ